MKRIPIYIVLIALTFMAPVSHVNVGMLKPLEVVALSREKDLLVIRTDTDDKGSGNSLETALTDMKQTSSGVIYLDTARYLIYTPDTREEADRLRTRMHKKVKMFSYNADLDLKEVAKYLKVHG